MSVDHVLEQYLVKDVADDEQHDAIGEFFNGPGMQAYWEQAGFGELTGSDAETDAMINYALNHVEVERHRAILISWRDLGF